MTKSERNRAYYLKNRVAIREAQRRWREANRERVRALEAKYRAEKRHVIRAQNRKCRMLDWPCLRGCGRATTSISGVCRQCQKITCRVCLKPFVPRWQRQRRHVECARIVRKCE